MKTVDEDMATAQDLVVEVEQQGESATLSVRGELDVSTAPDLADLCRSVHAKGARDVVIDLTDTSFLDSSGSARPGRARTCCSTTSGAT